MEPDKQILMMMMGMVFAGFADYRRCHGYLATVTAMDYQGGGCAFTQWPLWRE